MTTGSVSPRRADTRRNHERILLAAAKSLTSTGRVSFNEIAKQAGVGVGTVYRHFPTREELVLAVYRREVDHLVDMVPELLGEHSPEEAFRIWITDHVSHYMMTKRGLTDALSAAAAQGRPPVNGYAAMLGAVRTLLDANARAGTIRAELEPETVVRGLSGLLFLDPGQDWSREAERLIDLLWQGMRAD